MDHESTLQRGLNYFNQIISLIEMKKSKEEVIAWETKAPTRLQFENQAIAKSLNI